VPLARREFLAAAAAFAAATACGLFDGDDRRRLAYGSAPSQFGDLSLPYGDPKATVVLVHGGSWRTGEELALMEPMAADLRYRGYAVWNVEYRRVGEPGGGWPGTFEDVAAAVDHVAALADDHPVDPDRVVVVGHSAGGTLALGVPGRTRTVTPLGVASLAGVTDLAACLDDADLGPACAAAVGGTPAEVPARYRRASPVEALPTGTRVGLVHGRADVIVPVTQSETYAAAARAAGDDVTLDTVPDTGHFEVIDPTHPAYTRLTDQLQAMTR